MSQAQELNNKLKLLQNEALKLISEMSTSEDLYSIKVQYWGKAGKITALMKEMGSLSAAERPVFGKVVNEVKDQLDLAYGERESSLRQQEIHLKMQREKMDFRVPLQSSEGRGSYHPVFKVTSEIVEIMSRLGYGLRLGPWVESDFYNFEALNIPQNHPARDMQDTFFIDPTHVLRTHTSPIQIHSMEKESLPLRVIGTGAVFRVDSDVSHLPHFHQIEALCVDKKVSMADLKGTISYFVNQFFGAGLKTRFRPSYFPFTEPSAEVDCTCPICRGAGCSLCKQSGWIEIGGCGLVNPKVFQSLGMPEGAWQGFAFGFGIERMAIIKYGIDDIRLFPENDDRFLRQF